MSKKNLMMVNICLFCLLNRYRRILDMIWKYSMNSIDDWTFFLKVLTYLLNLFLNVHEEEKSVMFDDDCVYESHRSNFHDHFHLRIYD